MIKSLTYSLFGLLCISAVAQAGDSPMFEHTKTYCFGRYLVDIPIEAELKGNGATLFASDIKSERISLEKFKQTIQQREQDFAKKNYAADYSDLVKNIQVGQHGRMLIGHENAFGSEIYNIHSFNWVQGTAFYTHQSYGGEYIDKFTQKIKDYLLNTRYRPTNQIPSEPGFCFENGFVANDGKQSQVERATLSFTLKNHPDVWINIESTVYFKQQASLLTRAKAAGVEKRFPGRVTIVSQQSRDINQMNGEESLQYGQLDGGKGLTHAFAWETLGMVGDPLHASVHLDINTGADIGGNEVGASLTTPEVKALYETIVKTIRLRPTGGDTKPSTSGPQPKPAAQLPIGSKAASGSTCPQTGTWRCEQATAQDPERHFMVGQTLPPVMVAVKRNLWQTLKGGAEQVAQDTNWVLVQHDDAG